MSGNSDIVTCPRCENETLEVYVDWKPFDYSMAACNNCGFGYYTKTYLLNKKNLAKSRKEAKRNGFEYVGFYDIKKNKEDLKEFDKIYIKNQLGKS